MLILARKTNEQIVIGDSIEIHVIEVRGDVVKLGIKAPRDVRVYRREVFDEISRQNQEAVVQSPGTPVLPRLEGSDENS